MSILLDKQYEDMTDDEQIELSIKMNEACEKKDKDLWQKLAIKLPLHPVIIATLEKLYGKNALQEYYSGSFIN